MSGTAGGSLRTQSHWTLPGRTERCPPPGPPALGASDSGNARPPLPHLQETGGAQHLTGVRVEAEPSSWAQVGVSDPLGFRSRQSRQRTSVVEQRRRGVCRQSKEALSEMRQPDSDQAVRTRGAGLVRRGGDRCEKEVTRGHMIVPGSCLSHR